MKLKYILPIVTAGMFVACSDDNPSQPINYDPNAAALSSASATPVPVDPTAPVVPPVDPNAAILSSASAIQNPVDPNVPVVPVDPNVPVVPVDPNVPVNPVDPNVPVNPVDPNTPVVPVVPPAEDGKLTALDPTKSYTFYGAELTGLEQFKYGRFEARMKMASIPGSVSSMFLIYDYAYKKGVEPWNEIDIEILGKDQTKWQSNLITRYPDEDKKNPQITSEKIHEYGFNATEDFHLYGIVWTPEYISWEIDSVEVRREVLGDAKGQVEFMTEEQSLRFNLWAANSAGWVGKFTGIGLPVEQQIDYVRVYKYDPATKGFTFHWQDDFNELDFDRWSRGDWDMEKVQLRAQNVKVKDGILRLIMDYEET